MSQGQAQLYSIANEKGKKLPFAIIQAEKPAESPIVVAFHGWTGGLNVKRDFDTMITPAHVHEFPQNWNVVLPQDRYGYARCGSWWLGEKGDFFLLKLLDDMIAMLRNQLGFQGDIYTYGTSMGGFGALMHGLRWKARAIAANVPQVRLLNSEWAEQHSRLLKFVFGADLMDTFLTAPETLGDDARALMRHADVTNFLDASLPLGQRPTMLLAQSRYDITRTYPRDHCFYLVDKLFDCDINFELRTFPEFGHREYIGALEAIAWFDAKKDVIETGIDYDTSTAANANARYAENVLAQYALDHNLL